MPSANSVKINESIGSFLDALTSELQRLLSTDLAGQVTVSWSRDLPNAAVPDAASSDVASSDSASSDAEGVDLVWWSCALSVDPACRIYAGANPETWKEIRGADAADADFADAGSAEANDPQENWFSLLTQSIEQAAKARFGALVSCTGLGVSEDSPSAWPRVSVAVARGGNPSPGTMYLALSPELAVALGGDPDHGAAGKNPPATNPLEILQHLEIPLSVSFGRTQMRLRDLLALANGSVVQLDRELGDEVEIRVNNCVIARGEVVAVDGNYGVRILEMASGSEMASGASASGRGARTG